MTSPNLTQLTELSRLNTSLGFLQKRNFLERRGTEVSSGDVYVTSFVYAEHSPLDQPSNVASTRLTILQF